MSQQIDVSFVNKYRADVKLLLQQKQSRLESLVRKESQKAQFEFYDAIGPVAAKPWGARHGDTPLMETPHTRRRVGMSPWIFAELLDKPDRIRMLADPQGPYTRNAIMAFNRRKDDIILEAMTAPAFTGKHGEIAVDFPASQLMKNADVMSSTGSNKISVALLTAIKEQFWNNDFEEGDQIYMAVSPNSITTLLEDNKVTSADYNTVRALVQGDVDTFMGIKFIRTTRLPVEKTTSGAAGYIRTNYCWTKDSMLLSVGQDIQVDVDKRPDKKNATQIMVTMDIGASRMEEKGVLAFETYEKKAPVKPAP